jgi:heme a synthase
VNELSTARIIRRYRKIGLVTIGAVVFLILIGGIVRSTGAGMGCPDWPKCFGMWVPPTDVSQLPVNYQEMYGSHGYGDTAFNVVKTWTEYLNRLVGVIIGFLILGTYYFSRPLRSHDARIHWLSLAALLMVIFQGWLGGQVVDTNLAVWMVSIHMLVALAILLVLIAAVLIAYLPEIDTLTVRVSGYAVGVGIAVLVLTLVQVLLGIQVRESVDIVSADLGDGQRSTWIESLGSVYQFHRLFYYAVVAGLVAWFWMIREAIKSHRLYRSMAFVLLGLVGAEVLLGLVMHHFAIPPFAQPLHLTIATGLIGLEFCLTGIILAGNTPKPASEKENRSALSQPV